MVGDEEEHTLAREAAGEAAFEGLANGVTGEYAEVRILRFAQDGRTPREGVILSERNESRDDPWRCEELLSLDFNTETTEWTRSPRRTA